jgi:glycosyltransferase involved in cell wall biosynthesis
MDSSFAERFEFILIDSTQVSNPPPGIAKRSLFAMRRLGRFLTEMIRARPDAVLLFAPVGAGLLEKGVMARIARWFRVPSILFPLGAGIIDTYRDSRWQRTWIAWVFRASSVNCCQGRSWQEFFVGDLGLSASKSPIIGSWTATPDLIALGARRGMRESAAPPRLLFLGWLEREKGILELLEACAAIRGRAAFHLTIAGGGHAEAEARLFVKTNQLSPFVDFAGWVRGEELNRLFAQSDVLVLPSWAEGFPMAVVEAMAAGLAVLTTAVGVIPDVLTDGIDALIVPPRDVKALTAALERLIIDKDLRDTLQTQGHQFAIHNFTPELAAANLASVINEEVLLRFRAREQTA